MLETVEEEKAALREYKQEFQTALLVDIKKFLEEMVARDRGPACTTIPITPIAIG